MSDFNFTTKILCVIEFLSTYWFVRKRYSTIGQAIGLSAEYYCFKMLSNLIAINEYYINLFINIKILIQNDGTIKNSGKNIYKKIIYSIIFYIFIFPNIHSSTII